MIRIFGELCLLTAFVGAGFSAFVGIAFPHSGRRALSRAGILSAFVCIVAVTAVVGILAWALLVKDFRFEYVTQYSSKLLPWHYSLSALWVGQAGSLLLWSWLLAMLSLVFHRTTGRITVALGNTAFGILMANLCFLLAIMIFAANPMASSVVPPDEGAGLSPLLQHPSMMIHPPVVFLGYAGWTIPFAIIVAGLRTNLIGPELARLARPWALFAWMVLGVGILLGADWAYQELGWGGYWAWDPVENGSLIPWLTGTALIHSLMAWQYRTALQKTAIGLAITTFGLCNFATFLTRSGIFSSVHAFSQSPIGWMFLVLMAALLVGGAVLVAYRRRAIGRSRPIASLWARESMVLLSAVLLLLLVGVAIAGTLIAPLSKMIVGRQITVGLAFYNNVLIPTGLLLLAATACAPLLRWGAPPTPPQKRCLIQSAILAAIIALLAVIAGVRHPIYVLVAFLAALAVATFFQTIRLDARKHTDVSGWKRILQTIVERRRQYAGFLIHMGFVSLAVGIAGSSLGTRRHDVRMREGESIEWAGRSIRYERLVQRETPDKLIAEVVLAVARNDRSPVFMSPARHLYLLQNTWTTEVAIHSTWASDFYVIVHNGEGGGAVNLTFIENPMMRWMWMGGGIIVAGGIVVLCSSRTSPVASSLPAAEETTAAEQRATAA